MKSKRSRVGRTFGDVLREARHGRKVTQEELAGLADYGTVFISLLENGHRQPTISAILAFEEALGLAPGELVKRTKIRLSGQGKRKTP